MTRCWTFQPIAFAGLLWFAQSSSPSGIDGSATIACFLLLFLPDLPFGMTIPSSRYFRLLFREALLKFRTRSSILVAHNCCKWIRHMNKLQSPDTKLYCSLYGNYIVLYLALLISVLCQLIVNWNVGTLLNDEWPPLLIEVS